MPKITLTQFRASGQDFTDNRGFKINWLPEDFQGRIYPDTGYIWKTASGWELELCQHIHTGELAHLEELLYNYMVLEVWEA